MKQDIPSPNINAELDHGVAHLPNEGRNEITGIRSKVLHSQPYTLEETGDNHPESYLEGVNASSSRLQSQQTEAPEETENREDPESENDIHDTIVLRALVPRRQVSPQTRLKVNQNSTETPAASEQTPTPPSQRPQRTRKPVDLFKPANLAGHDGANASGANKLRRSTRLDRVSRMEVNVGVRGQFFEG